VKAKKKMQLVDYFENAKFQPMRMVVALKRKFPKLHFNGTGYQGVVDKEELALVDECSPKEFTQQTKQIETILGNFIVQQLGDESRKSYVNETIRLFRLSI